MATILHRVSQQRLCIDVTVNQAEKTALILGKKLVSCRTFGVALEHKAALMGIAVQPLARSDSASENMKSVVRSSRSCGYLAMTAIANPFNVMFRTIIIVITIGLNKSSNVLSFILQVHCDCSTKHVLSFHFLTQCAHACSN